MTTGDDLKPGDLETLRQSTEALMGTVSSLAEALGETNAAATAAKQRADAVAEDIQENVIPRQQLELRWKQEDENLRKLIHRVKVWVVVAACVGVLAAAIGFGGGIYLGRKAATVVKDDRITACEARNTANLKASREGKLAFRPYLAQETEEKHPDPVVIHILQAIEETPPSISKCR